jgi:hypothetical protein
MFMRDLLDVIINDYIRRNSKEERIRRLELNYLENKIYETIMAFAMGHTFYDRKEYGVNRENILKFVKDEEGFSMEEFDETLRLLEKHAWIHKDGEERYCLTIPLG